MAAYCIDDKVAALGLQKSVSPQEDKYHLKTWNAERDPSISQLKERKRDQEKIAEISLNIHKLINIYFKINMEMIG